MLKTVLMYEDIDLETVMFGLLVFIIVSFVIGTIGFAVAGSAKLENDRKPIEKKQAKVMEKTSASGMIAGIEDWVIFEFDDGTRVRLLAKGDNHLTVGDTGLLTWQGNRIVNFERNK